MALARAGAPIASARYLENAGVKNKTAAELIAFETKVAAAFAAGELPFLIHLSGGNEEELIKIFAEAELGDWFISSHRNHYHYLLAGGSEEMLMSQIRAGRSMFIFDSRLNFLSTAILGGLCGTAAGIAWEIKNRGEMVLRHRPHVWCFLGDGAEDNGHLYEAVLFVQGHNLPCTFIIEDNDRSVDVPKSQRTGGFRIDWPSCVRRYSYVPTFPHAGAGLKTMIEFKPDIVDRFCQKNDSLGPGAATHTPA